MNEEPKADRRSRRFAAVAIAASGLVVALAVVVAVVVFRGLDSEQAPCHELRTPDLEALFREAVEEAKRAPVGPEKSIRCHAAADDGTGTVDVRIADGTADEVRGYLAFVEDLHRVNRQTPVAVPGLAERAIWVHRPDGYSSELAAVSATRFVHVELATWHLDEADVRRAAEMLVRRAL